MELYLLSPILYHGVGLIYGSENFTLLSDGDLSPEETSVHEFHNFKINQSMASVGNNV
jgi:hypothetical protein